MNIQFDEQNRIFKIDTERSSYVIAVVDEEGFLAHVYYGPYIRETALAYRLRLDDYPFVPSKNGRERLSFLDSLPQEFPGNDLGDFRESAVEITDEAGHHAVQFFYDSYVIHTEKPGLPGLPATFGTSGSGMTLDITLKEPVLGLEAVLSYSVFVDCEAIVRSVRIVNSSEQEIRLDKIMSMSLDMDDEGYQMLSLHGGWARERQMEFRTIGHGKQSVGSVRGESSHQEHPFVALVGEHASEETGNVYGFHFIYSGNFLAQVEKNQFDMLRVSVGIHPKGFGWSLKPGESFTAPEVACVFSDKGLGGMTRNYHDLYRNHLIRSEYLDKERPVLINNWEATYFEFDSEKLLSIAREAKKAGIEMLVMDDGWFGHRDDDNSSLGDWEVNEEKLKGGLKKLVDEVNEIGLKFGIWFEPEMVSPESKLYKAHPDWAIQIPGRKGCLSRNQYVLDLSRKEVVEYVYESVAKILRSANIAYVKWDMNRHLTDLGSATLGKERQGELFHRYVLAVYELQERLMMEFPELLLENCSSGGARFDPGMLYYSPQIWCSDDTDAIERLKIQEGTALLYPLSTMGAHVSDCPNHAIGRVTPFQTRGDVALAGTFGYELDITKIPEEDRKLIPNQIQTYHKYHHLIRRGDYYRIASYQRNGEYDCYLVAAKDQSEALMTYVQVMARPGVPARFIKVPGLAPEKSYRIEGEERVYSGDTLANVGIPVRGLKGDFQSKLIHITEVPHS